MINFIEVSSFPSLSAACKQLDVSQPALSESIGRLEKDVGFKLFYRTKNGISLTPEGRRTLDQAKKIQGLLASLGPEEETNTPTIVLGCHSTVGSYFLPQFFMLAAKALPGYKVQLRHDLSRNIQTEIQAGKIDIGVVVNANAHPDLVIKPIATDKVCVWRSRKIIPQNQIIADPNLFQVQSTLKKWTKSPKNIIPTDNLELIARMTQMGCGYGIIPERMVNLLGLDLIQESHTPVFKDEFSLVYRPEFGKSKYEKTIVSIIKETFYQA